MAKIDRIHTLCAAYLAGEKNTQVEIAAALHIGQASVSRLLAQAKAEGLLIEDVRFANERIPPGELEEVRRRVVWKEDEMMGKVGRRLGLAAPPRLRIFSSGEGGHDTLTQMRVFARNAAPYLRELMRGCLSSGFGVTWGRMLHNVVDSLAAEGYPSPWAPNGAVIDVVPLVGDPLDQKPADTGSTALAHRLSSLVNADLEREYHSLSMVPMMIPEDFKKDAELQVVRRLSSKVHSYRKIFGLDEQGRYVGGGRVESLDAVFTSVGPAEHQFGWAGSSLVKNDTLADLQQRAHGDIGGVVIPKDEFIGDAKLEYVAKRWNGVKIAHLKKCFERSEASQSKYPGVVAICLGAKRADFIFQVLQAKAASPGLINHLVVDHTFAERFFALAEAAPKDARPVKQRPAGARAGRS